MYLILQREEDLHNLEDKIKDKDRILTRFRMNGCPSCITSQSDWDRMTTRMTPQLGNRHAMIEVESDLVDRFRQIMENNQKRFPPVTRFPSMYIMKRGVATHYPNRDSQSLIQLLHQMKMVQPKPFTPKIPTVKFMEKTLSPLKKVSLTSKRRSLSKPTRRTRTPLSFTVRRRTPKKLK